jgi:ubiquinone/menaquinone biosynthesis C-methylase UbiE/DNA-binding transcriptional ArsR family regulator
MTAALKQPDALLGWMESLADSTRLRLLRLLERHELGVAELCHVLQMPQSTVSRHLKILADQGWVRNRSHRTANLYRMSLVAGDSATRRLWMLTKGETVEWATVQQDQLRLTRLLAQRQPTSETFFTGAARHWDRLRRDVYGEGFYQAAFLALLQPEWVVADLGCGTGQTAAALAPHVKQVIGVDQSAAMLKAARKRTVGLNNVELRQGHLEALPLDSGSCDAALLLLALTYVPEAERVAKEVGRILAPEGRAVVVDLLRHDREDFRIQMGQQRLGWETSELQELLEGAGFRDVKCLALPPEPQATGPALLLASGRRPVQGRVIAIREKQEKQEEKT